MTLCAHKKTNISKTNQQTIQNLKNEYENHFLSRSQGCTHHGVGEVPG